MTRYEKYRVILHFTQVIATFLIPIVAVILGEWLRRHRQKQLHIKYKYKYKYVDGTLAEDVEH